MSVICPTILAADTDGYLLKAELLSFAHRGQIDITDGEFAKSQTVSLQDINTLPWVKTDLHLMVNDPSPLLQKIIDLRPNLVIFHVEASIGAENLVKIMRKLREFRIGVGIAVLPESFVDDYEELVKLSEHCLIFGGNLGYMGGNADLTQLKKVNQIRAIKPEIEIGWDGGANLKNVAGIAHADVDVINVGSAITFSEDPRAEFEKLTDRIRK